MRAYITGAWLSVARLIAGRPETVDQVESAFAMFLALMLLAGMVRTKITVSAAALGLRKKPFHVNVTRRTTGAQVVSKVLEKLQCRDPPSRYQLWAVAAEKGECYIARLSCEKEHGCRPFSWWYAANVLL